MTGEALLHEDRLAGLDIGAGKQGSDRRKFLSRRGGGRFRRRFVGDGQRRLLQPVHRDDGVGDLADHHREEGRGQNAARNRVETGHSQIPERQKFRTML